MDRNGNPRCYRAGKTDSGTVTAVQSSLTNLPGCESVVVIKCFTADLFG